MDYITEKVKLLHGDCLELMKDVPDQSVDLTVTSPPYDNLRTYNGTLNDWTPEKWQAIIRELFRVTKQGGVVVWIVGDATIKGSETGASFRQALYAMECGFKLHDTMIWAKDSSPFPMTNRYYQAFEYMFVFSKGSPKTANLLRDKPNKYAGTSMHGTVRRQDGTTQVKSAVRQNSGRLVREFGTRLNYWSLPSEKNSKAFSHPAMFPEPIARDHIVSWSNPGDVVLDPFLGSGTTGKMALLEGRRFIGIEREPEYFQIAQNRIQRAFDGEGSK